jgi:hypothetical protein
MFQKYFLKYFKEILTQINIFYVFLNYFDVRILKIILYLLFLKQFNLIVPQDWD